MEIKRVSIIGLGALGVLYGHHLSKRMDEGDLRIIADEARIRRYKEKGVICNGEICRFNYVTPDEPAEAADLILIAVKFGGLEAAVDMIKNHVGRDTLILSLLNGISSEQMIEDVYGKGKVLDCVAQGMDAVKVDNALSYKNMGLLCFGDREGVHPSEKAARVARFFDKTRVPYLLDPNMKKRMWGKFMLNVGVNQVVSFFEGDYGTIQEDGPARDMMIAAMREVLILSQKEGVCLTEEDLGYWLSILEPLNPKGKPSMRQDMEARRPSEVGLFARTVIRLGEKHGIETPVNQKLYDYITSVEKTY
ncbi:MAG: ketopantoate reductase family protein [Clostridiales bacterium]|nr:ketopantoate reductase family protein [Clostridiales bacterium]